MTISTTFLRALDRAAHDIAEDGIDAHPAMVDHLVRVARRHGLSPTLATVLADPTAPAVARERAFGRLAATLAAATSAPRPDRRAA